MTEPTQETRKLDHIDLALRAQINRQDVDQRFIYEPLLSSHPSAEIDLSVKFLGKNLKAPLWISSMTGGVGPAKHINQNLARVCREFGLGMGLGSCRVLFENDIYFNDFNLRPILGYDLPFYANLGIAQVEHLLSGNNQHQICDLINRLDADGLIVHVNPLQEWFQPEGDRLKFSPIDTLIKLCHVLPSKIIVKEVGQGFGPQSLKALLELPLAAIDLAAFGGTNFTKLEQIRSQASGVSNNHNTAFSKVGHTASEMVMFLNKLLVENSKFKDKEIIISGGVENILDGFYLRQKLNYSSVIGQAKNYLNHAENYDELQHFVADQINGLKIAKAFLVVKNQESL